MEYEMCLVYEKDKECPGAGGGKLRRVCIYCPNYQRYLKRKEVGDQNGDRNVNQHRSVDCGFSWPDLERQEGKQE